MILSFKGFQSQHQGYSVCLMLGPYCSYNRNRSCLMIGILLMMVISSVCLSDYTKPPKNIKYTLSPNNLIINPQIKQPNLEGKQYKLCDSIQGWSSKKKYVQINNGCVLSLFCPTYKYCGSQFLDLDSLSINEQYYQRFNLTAGRDFQIQFDWVVYYTTNKLSLGLSLLWNNFTIDKFFKEPCDRQTQTYYVTSIDQVNQIVFQGEGIIDSLGINIGNIFVRELIYDTPISNLPTVPHFQLIPNQDYDYSKPSRFNAYSLNTTNIIINPLIDQPKIQPQTSKTFPKSVNGWSTKLLYVQYIDGSDVRYCNGQDFKGLQFIDTDSINSNQRYYQTFNLSKQYEFELKFDWLPESPYNSQSTGFSVLWNNVTIVTFYDNGCSLRTSAFYLKGVSGMNQVVFQGMGAADSQGILIRNVLLRELLYKQEDLSSLETVDNSYSTVLRVFDQLMNSSFGMIGNSLSAKGNLQLICGYMVEFTHFVPYNYHLLNHTLMANVILVGMKAFDDQRGALLDHYVYPYFNATPQSILQDYTQQSNLSIKIERNNPFYLYRPNGSLLEITDGFFVSFLATFFFFTLGTILFWLLSKYRISLIFRQFSILNCFWFVCFNGRIEMLTFNFLSNALMLNSSSFLHKIKNIAIIYCYFVVFLVAVASMLVFRSIYGKILKYINQNCRNRSLSSTFYMCLSFGLYNIVLGALHRLLLPFPLIQLYSLLVFEATYVSLMIALIFRKFFKNIFLAITLCLMNLSRLSFFATFLVFHYWGDLEQVISTAQKYIFCTFVVLWGLSLLIFILDKIRLVYTLLRHSCSKKNRVAPTDLKKKQQFPLKRASFIERQSNSQITSLRQFMKSSKLIKDSASKRINLFEKQVRQEKRINLKKKQIKN